MDPFSYRIGFGSIFGLSDVEALKTMDRPTIFRIPGEDHSRAVLVSTLLHGREPSGFRAFLREAETEKKYPFDVYFSVGNVQAAKIFPYFSQRDVPGKEDFNRVWVDTPCTEDQRVAAAMGEFFDTLPLVAFLDIHSYLAKTIPPHGVISKMDSATKDLIQKLSPSAFLMDMNLGTLLERMGRKTTAVLVETGVNNSPEAEIYADTTLQKFFEGVGISSGVGIPHHTKFYHKGIQFKIAEDASVTWADTKNTKYSLTLPLDLEHLNHRLVREGEFLGWADSLEVFRTNDLERHVEDYFYLQEGKIRLKQNVVPNFLNVKEDIMKKGGFYFFQEFS